jgi:DNA-binding NarL/FixJ family response regulator
VDHQLPDEDGLSLCLWLTTRAPAPAVVILVPNPSAELALAAQVAGAARLVPSSCSAPELRAAVRAAAAREPWEPSIPPRVARTQGERLAAEDLPILGMLRHGVAAAEIAATLGLTDKGLVARRWAMMEALTAPRAELRPARRLRPLRALSPSPVTG